MQSINGAPARAADSALGDADPVRLVSIHGRRPAELAPLCEVAARVAPPHPSGEVETWRQVVDHEGVYAVSDLGRVMRVGSGPGAHVGKVLRPLRVSGDYVQVFLGTGPGRTPRPHRVHKLVALAWIGPRPVGCEINHKDGCKTNNAVGNLEYLSSRENSRHAARTGLCRSAKLTPTTVREIRRLAGEVPRQVLAVQFGVSRRTVTDVITGYTWSHID